jgi:hypothetical protein
MDARGWLCFVFLDGSGFRGAGPVGEQECHQQNPCGGDPGGD